MGILISRTSRVSMEVARGVEVRGVYHDRQSGDPDTPAAESWVDPDSLEIAGRPDLVAQYLADEGIDAADWDLNPEARASLLADLAESLRIHHEDTAG